MSTNEAEDIIELTEVIEEPAEEGGEPDEEAIRKAFEDDDFFSKLEEVDAHSDSSEGTGKEEESFPDDEASFDELLESEDEDQEPDTVFDESLLEPSEDAVDLEGLSVPEPDGSEPDETELAAELDTSFELAESLEEAETEEIEAETPEQEDVEDEFGELEDFKIDVSILSPGSDSGATDEDQPQQLSEPSTVSGDDAEGRRTEEMSSKGVKGTVSPEKVEAVLERVAREVLGEAAERIFSRVAEEVLKEEIERIKAEISRLSNRE